MPKYVWITSSGKYAAQGWDRENQKTVHYGSYDTEEEAIHAQLLGSKGHHWLGMPEVVPEEFFGFTYRMTHRKTGRMYLGAKQLLFWAGPQGGYKCSDPRDPEFDRSLWVESDWRTYTGSSKKIKAMIDKEGPHAFSYEIIQLHHNKLDLFYNELRDQMEADVLYALDSNGDYVYLNDQIMGVEYRPIAPRAKIIAMRDQSEQEVRDYYLRPKLCGDCGSVIPFGETKCPSAPVFGNGGCTNERNVSNG